MAFAGGRSIVMSSVCPNTAVRTGPLSARSLPADIESAPPPDDTSAFPRSQERPRDDVPLYFARAIPDSLDPRVAPPPLHWQLIHQSHAAEDLHGLVSDPSQ